MSDPNAKEARKEMYQVLRKANPLADSQVLKQLAYDLTQQAIKNLNAENLPALSDPAHVDAAINAIAPMMKFKQI